MWIGEFETGSPVLRWVPKKQSNEFDRRREFKKEFFTTPFLWSHRETEHSTENLRNLWFPQASLCTYVHMSGLHKKRSLTRFLLVYDTYRHIICEQKGIQSYELAYTHKKRREISGEKPADHKSADSYCLRWILYLPPVFLLPPYYPYLYFFHLIPKLLILHSKILNWRVLIATWKISVVHADRPNRAYLHNTQYL